MFLSDTVENSTTFVMHRSSPGMVSAPVLRSTTIPYDTLRLNVWLEIIASCSGIIARNVDVCHRVAGVAGSSRLTKTVGD